MRRASLTSGRVFSQGSWVSDAGGSLLFKYVAAGSVSSIDSGTSGSMAGPLPQNFNTLEVWLLMRTDEAVGQSRVDVWFNNDSAADYDDGYIAANTNVTQAGFNAALSGLNPQVPGTSSDANKFDVTRMTIPFYTQTTAHKTAEVTEAHVETSSSRNFVGTWGVTWRNTAAITRISIQPHVAGKNLIAGSAMLIYGR